MRGLLVSERIDVTCKACGKVYHLPASAKGRMGNCTCGSKFLIGEQPEAVTEPEPSFVRPPPPPLSPPLPSAQSIVPPQIEPIDPEPQVIPSSTVIASQAPTRFTEYKVIRVSEGGCSTLLFGHATIPEQKLSSALNSESKLGWQVVFQVVEQTRFLIFWRRESVLVTLGR